MALYTPFPMTLPIAKEVAQFLAENSNAPKWIGCVGRATGLTVAMLDASGLEKALEMYFDDEKLGSWARKAAETLQRVRDQAEAKKAAKVNKKKPLQCIKNIQKIGGTKRKNEDKAKDEPKKKIAKIEEMEEDDEEEYDDEEEEFVGPKRTKKSLKVLNSSLIDPAAELAEKLKDLPSKPTRSDVQNMVRSFGRINPVLLQDAEDIIGRKMRRADDVWWLLLLIKFGLPKTKTSMDVRDVYAKEEMKQKREDEECVQRLIKLYGK